MKSVEIIIDMDIKCLRCRKKGATQNGFCLSCINKFLVENGVENIHVAMEKYRKRKLRPA